MTTDLAVHIEQVKLGEAPALLAYRGSPTEAAAKGTILFHHGLGASKEANKVELKSLASQGYLAVGLDNVGHGARRYEDFDERFSGRHVRAELIHAVEQTAAEVPTVVDALLANYGASEARLGIGGISMGGFIAYGALLADPRLKVATPILGSPRWWSDAPGSPHRHLDLVFPRAILSQNAGRDENVLPKDAREFHEQLAVYYASAPERQRYVEFPDAEHFMPERDWTTLWKNVLEWYAKYL